jgi:hypothetical protein
LAGELSRVRRRVAVECRAASDAAEAVILGLYAWRLAAIDAALGKEEAAAARRTLVTERDASVTRIRSQFRAERDAQIRAEVSVLVGSAADERSRRQIAVRAFRAAATPVVRRVERPCKMKRTPVRRPFLRRCSVEPLTC